MNGGADAPVRGRPPGRPVACGNVLILRAKSGSRGTRADQGVRPTNFYRLGGFVPRGRVEIRMLALPPVPTVTGTRNRWEVAS